MKLLREYIRNLILEIYRKEDGKKDEPEEDLLLEPDEPEASSEKEEASGAGAAGGYTLPLGASNSPSTLRQRAMVAGQGFGGAKPLKKKKSKD